MQGIEAAYLVTKEYDLYWREFVATWEVRFDLTFAKSQFKACCLQR
jgi:hypothetical protein